MRLSEEQIKQLVEAPENPVLQDNRELQDFHRLHVTGEGYEGALTQIIGYENVEQFKQKKLLTKPFTRPLLKYIIDAQGRWKSAQGTNKYYNFKGEKPEQSKAFDDEILSQVWKGGSINDFTKKFLSTAIYTDFNGFFIVERGKIEVVEGIKYETREGKTRIVDANYESKPYVIYKDAKDIHNFSVTGNNVDWLIYMLPKPQNAKYELYRVIDEKYDYIVQKEGRIVTIQDDKIEHKAGQTPVVPVSIINKVAGFDYRRTSPIDALIPLLDYYLNQYGEHVVSCLLHAHPIYYQVGQKCQSTLTYGDNERVRCEGGYHNYQYNGKSYNAECKACNGTGHNIHKDASTAIILPAKTEQGEAFNITNVVGYATPPIDILKNQVERLDGTKKEILEAATGQIGAQNLNEKTATETVLNMKPLEDIIGEVIDVIEYVETALTNIIGRIYYGDKYIGCEINYGRKLNLRDDNIILDEIKQAKESGSSNFYIKSLFEELVYSRFSRSKIDLQRNILAAEVEPYPGFTFKEIEESQNIPKVSKVLKQNITEYLQRFEAEVGDMVAFDKSLDNYKKVQKIKEKLLQYATEDLTKISENETSPINQNNEPQP
jgi:hypothetical protein